MPPLLCCLSSCFALLLCRLNACRVFSLPAHSHAHSHPHHHLELSKLKDHAHVVTAITFTSNGPGFKGTSNDNFHRSLRLDSLVYWRKAVCCLLFMASRGPN